MAEPADLPALRALARDYERWGFLAKAALLDAAADEIERSRAEIAEMRAANPVLRALGQNALLSAMASCARCACDGERET